MTLRGVFAVLLAAILGLAAMMGAGLVLGDQVVLVMVLVFPQMLLFGVALAALIPLCRRVLPGLRGAVLAIFVVTVGALVLGVLLQISDSDEDNMPLLSLAFAVIAVPVHWLIARRPAPSGPPAED